MHVCFLVIGKDFSGRNPHITRSAIATILGNDEQMHFIVCWCVNMDVAKEYQFFFLVKENKLFGLSKDLLREPIYIPNWFSQ